MNNKTYFAKISENLEKIAAQKVTCSTRQDFSSLKILEYWVRILQENPYAISTEIATKLMDIDHLATFVESVVELFKPHIKVKKGRHGEDDEYECDVCSGGVFRAIKRYMDEYKPSCRRMAVLNFMRDISHVDSDDMAPQLYLQLRRSLVECFIKCALKAVKKGIRATDPTYRRVLKLQNAFRLTDDEIEVLLYLWLRNSDDLSICDVLAVGMRRRRRPHFMDGPVEIKDIASATGMNDMVVSTVLSSKGSLKKLSIVDSDFDLVEDVSKYLDGYTDVAELKSFKQAPACTVPFAQLQGDNPDAHLVLDMLRNHDRKGPLNILFYGVEGTGKTELAKAVAQELGVPLWEVGINGDDRGSEDRRRSDSRCDFILQNRMRAITLADWHCESNPGIILVDEADLVLNGCEKGVLNRFFEDLRTPVIWISNSMNFVERSTRRRFDFSMAFKSLAKDERLSVLNSVLKAQKAESLFTPEEKLRLVVEYPAMAGGYTLAVKEVRALKKKGVCKNAYATACRMLKAHTRLLGIGNGDLRELESHAPHYSLEGLNIDGSVDEVMEVVRNYDCIWKGLNEDSAPNSLNILLYGPPGTGKTEFVRHMARTLGRNLIVKRASDLLGMFVGQTEAQIAAAFEEAERTKSILFIDEADSFLQDRSGAFQSHDISKVNEVLTRMECFKGIFVAATNYENILDAASRRRFALKLGFKYLKPEGVKNIWESFFPNVAFAESAASIPMLAPGDFGAVNNRLRYLPAESLTPERIERELRKEVEAKDQHAGRSMGF